jgi:hypothetical protein
MPFITVLSECPIKETNTYADLLTGLTPSYRKTDFVHATIITVMLLQSCFGQCKCSILYIHDYSKLWQWVHSLNHKQLGTTAFGFIRDVLTIGIITRTYFIACDTLPNRNTCKQEAGNASMELSSRCTDYSLNPLFLLTGISHIIHIFAWSELPQKGTIHFVCEIHTDFHDQATGRCFWQ